MGVERDVRPRTVVAGPLDIERFIRFADTIDQYRRAALVLQGHRLSLQVARIRAVKLKRPEDRKILRA